jgi:hypothetical protein
MARTCTGPCSCTLEESEVEGYEDQDNANIHCQPFPESVSEEREIYTDDDGYHRHHVKHVSYLSAHFSLLMKWNALAKSIKEFASAPLLAVVRIQDLEPCHWLRFIRPKSVLRHDAFQIAGADSFV